MNIGSHIPKRATIFEFVSYRYEVNSSDIFFSYKVHFSDQEPLKFEEKISLKDDLWSTKLPEKFVTAMLEDLHLILGISYYKLFCPPTFKTNINLSKAQVKFWNTIYTKGLGEFLYRNNLDSKKMAQFEATIDYQREVSEISVDRDSLLVGIGGGKDSIVALELLRDKYKLTSFVKEIGVKNEVVRQVAEMAQVSLKIVSRYLDPKILAGVDGAFKGHVPISVVYAVLGVLEAALGKQAYFVVANEYSSNFGNLIDEGNEVNHKWSGSSEFEIMYQKYLREQVTTDVGYFSLTRPFYELRVVEIFAALGRKYFSAFSSCNRNFVHKNTNQQKWCGECPKCAFTFLLLSAYLPKEEVIQIFSKDLFEDEELIPLYRDLLGFGDLKPFDCVGTFEESRMALRRVGESRPEALMVSELMPLVLTTNPSIEVHKIQKAETVPSQFRLLGMKSALILGYDKEGKVSEKYLNKYFSDTLVGSADMKDSPDYLDRQHDFDITVKTPGIPDHKVTRQSTTATQIFFSLVSRKQIIGITGSKGKSTTATLIYELLKAGGIDARLVGNIGRPALLEILEEPYTKDTIFVFELSSYQLEDLDVSPYIAVVTSLFPEHLDHHLTLENYFAAKKNIIRFQSASDTFIHANGFPELKTWADSSLAKNIESTSLSFKLTSPALRGDHMKSNAELAYTVAKLFGVTDKMAENTLAKFSGLPHRLKLVGIFAEIEFYDDSISTTPESAMAGIKALEKVDTIILGGVDRGYDFTELEKVLNEQQVRNVILFPDSGKYLLKNETGFNVLHTSSMAEALHFAFTYTKPGKICLLSPAAPSYNLFSNFEERGNKYIKAIKDYRHE